MDQAFLLKRTLGKSLGDAFIGCCVGSNQSVFADTNSEASALELAAECVRISESVSAELSRSGKSLNRQLVLFISRNTVKDIALLYGLSHAGLVPCIADPNWSSQTQLSICEEYGIELIAGYQPASDYGQPLILERLPEKDPKQRYELRYLPIVSGVTSEVKLDGLAFVRFSSGSTGRPKALAFDTMAAVSAATTWSTAAKLQKNDRILCMASINNGLAFNTSLLSSALSECSLYLHSGKYNPNLIWRKIRELRPTILVGFPFLWEILLGSSQRDLEAISGVRAIWSSAARLNQDLARKWYRELGVPIGHYYGVAETGPVTFNDGSLTHSQGKVLPGCTVSCGSTSQGEKTAGLLRILTPYMSKGYLAPKASAIHRITGDDGSFHSSDIGLIDEQNQLLIEKRGDRVANVRGQKFDLTVAEREIANKLGGCDVLLHQADDGEILLFVEGTSKNTEQGIELQCRKILESWQMPNFIMCCNKFPRSAAGKIMVAEILALSKFKAWEML